jgi:cytoskeletal protein CcmA (bactofilin family)
MKFDVILNSAIRKDSFVIPKEVVIGGSIKADTPGQISGIVNGDIICKARIVIHKDGIVNGNIIADELLVYGHINGDIKSCNKVTVQSGAVVKGNINTAEIHIEKEALIEGLIMKSGVQINKPGVARKKDPPMEPAVPVTNINDEIKQSWF